MHLMVRADNHQREAVDLTEVVRIEEFRTGVVRLHFRNGDKELYVAKLEDLLHLYKEDFDPRSEVNPVARPEASLEWVTVTEVQEAGKRAKEALDKIPYDNHLSEIEVHDLMGAAALEPWLPEPEREPGTNGPNDPGSGWIDPDVTADLDD